MRTKSEKKKWKKSDKQNRKMIFFKATKMQRQKPKEQSKKDQKAESIAGQNATTMTNNTMAGCQTICFHITQICQK